MQNLCGLLHYLLFAWKLMKASVEAFTATIEATREASIGAIESVEDSTEDMKDIKSSTEVTSKEGFTKASIKTFMEVSCTKASIKASWK